jgi:hypothetical protein
MSPIKPQVNQCRLKMYCNGQLVRCFNYGQQIMTELSGAATEEEKVAIITNAVFILLKLIGGSSSQAYENHSIQC